MSEDCLRLNVWTNGFARNAKRPVMVWLHGGGFTSGNGSYTMYDGGDLARKRDVVTVTINHRLNSFGFLHLMELGGEKYAHASNAGMLGLADIPVASTSCFGLRTISLPSRCTTTVHSRLLSS